MIKDLYPVNKYPFEELLLKNNYVLNEETFKLFIYNKYCVHRIKTKKDNIDKYIPCIRKKVEGKEFCAKHLPADVSFSNKCSYNNCKRITKKDKICCIHKKYLNKICNTPLPAIDYDELIFFGNNLYDCKIYNKNIKIIIKDYISDSTYSNNNTNSINKYYHYSFNNFLYNIYNTYKLLIFNIIKKYNINIKFLYNLLKLIYEFNKKDKKVSVLSNFNDKILEPKKKKKKNKKKKGTVPDGSTNENKETQNDTKTINSDKYDIYVLKYEYIKINKLKEILLKYHKDNNISDDCIKFYLKEINRVVSEIKDDENVYDSLRYYQDQFLLLLKNNIKNYGYKKKNLDDILSIAFFYHKNYYYFIDNWGKLNHQNIIINFNGY